MKKKTNQRLKKLTLNRQPLLCLNARNNHPDPPGSKNCISIFFCDLSGIYCNEEPDVHTPS